MSDTELTFLGTGTSQGVPIIGCGCDVCSSKDERDKRLRSSVLVTAVGDDGRKVRIVIDTGPDFRYQMLRENVREIDAILYTHEHIDHVMGMDDVRGFNYVMQKEVDIYCERRVEEALRRIFDYAFTEHKYPGVPDVVVHRIEAQSPFVVQGIRVIPVRGMHFKLPVLGYRIGNVCYLTDMNGIEEAEIGKFRGVDVLVINALRKGEHISHFSLEQALEVIKKAAPKRAYLTHVSHQLDTYERLMNSGELPNNVELAYDGLKIKA